ncbi:MAG: hypothetical protein N2747_07490 [Chitinophagaceae bacterium]|nr:hypothetical protein [Chitinophagaceae bacterium]
MSQLNNIKLNPLLLQQLYKNHLIDPDFSAKQENLMNRELPSKTTGSAKDVKETKNPDIKNILILFHDPENNEMQGPELTFLTEILKACKLTLQDVQLINLASETIPSLPDFLLTQNANLIILFCENKDLTLSGSSVTPYQLFRKEDKIILSASPLYIIYQNREEKRKLWQCLKQIFNL